jgi:gliding motility-associated-like protein
MTRIKPFVLFFSLILCLFKIGNGFAQAPVISSFSPASGPVGTTVTLTGTNFNITAANNVVFFGAVRASVLSAGSTQLKVTVPNGASYQPISVLNTGTHLTGFSNLPFDVTFAGSNDFKQADFTGAVSLPAGVNPNATPYIADIDGDGKPDLVIINETSGDISIFRNTSTMGSVSFGAKVIFATAANPTGLAVKDIDGDGKPDLVVTSYYNGTISVYRNTATPGTINGSSFAPPITIVTNYVDGYTLPIICDVDGDGKPDIILSSPVGTSFAIVKNLSVPGTINAASFAPKIDFSVLSSPAAITAGDLDGDGKPEIVVALTGTYGVFVYKNVATAGSITPLSLSAPQYFGSISSPAALSIADVDGDGKSDIIEASNNGLSILRNTGVNTIAFAQGVNFNTHVAPGLLAVSDLDGDGKPDYLIADYLGTGVAIIKNLAIPGTIDATSFSNEIGYQTASASPGVAIGDLDGDGIPEIFIRDYSTNSVSIVKGNSIQAPTITSFTPTAAHAQSIVTITGTNFTGTTVVSFGGVTASSYTVVSPTTITAIIGSGATGNVSVTTPGGTASLGGFVFLIPPKISYTTPQTFNVNTAISPLVPNTSLGGPIPATIYGQVSTFAGGSVGSVNGTGTSAGFHSPIGMATDAAGNIYVGDDVNSTIRKISPAGLVTTLAGSGAHGNTNGAGTNASFNAPFGVAVDGAGNVYVADEGNNLIRKITPAGDVTTLAGSGVASSVNSNGLSASFDHPYGVAVDAAGNVYVAEGVNNLIRKITPAADVTTFAGSGSPGSVNGNGTAASFRDPEGIAVDAAGNVYVADSQNNQVRKITPAGDVTTLAGSGATGFSNGDAAAASFNYPYGLTVDAFGNVYVADQLNNAIRKITPAGQVSTIAGRYGPGSANGVGPDATFNAPSGVTIGADGNVYVADSYNNAIRKIVTTGFYIDKALPPGLTFDPKTGIISGTPTAITPAIDYTITAYNAGGSYSTILNIKVTDNTIPAALQPVISYATPQTYSTGTTIAPLAPNTSLGGPVPATPYGQVSTFSGNGTLGSSNGTGSQVSIVPRALTTDPAGNLYAVDYTNTVRKVTAAGVTSTVAGNGASAVVDGPAATASFKRPWGVARDAAGNLYIADVDANLIRKITPDGTVSTFVGDGTFRNIDGQGTSASTGSPEALVTDAAGNIYASIGNQIKKITPEGLVSTIAGSGTSKLEDGTGTAASFLYPIAITIDAAGNLLVSDGNASSFIRKVTPAGVVTTIAGNGLIGSFTAVYGIAVDAAENIYLCSADAAAVFKIDASGKLSTLAGGPGTSIFSFPLGIAVDVFGNLFVADPDKRFIYKVLTTGYSIDKPLPAGLSFDTATGIISGTPTVTTPATDYKITAQNAGGSYTTTVTIKVNSTPAIAPPIISYVTPQVYKKGTAIASLLPTNKGGTVPATVYGQVSAFAGSGAKGSINGSGNGASFNNPISITTDAAGNVYVADQDNNLIRKITPAGVVTTYAGSGAVGSVNGAPSSASFMGTAGIAVDGGGNLYLSDSYAMIRKIAPGGVVSTYAGSTAQGNTNGPANQATFNNPLGLALDAAGNLYVAENANRVIRKIATDGSVSTFAGTGQSGSGNGPRNSATFNIPFALAFDADGNLYVSDAGNGLIRKINPAGMVSTVAGQGLLTTFGDVAGITIDAAGNIYVADELNKSIDKIDPAGNLTILAGNLGGFPTGLTVDQSGNLYVSDVITNSISKVLTTGYSIDKPLPDGLIFDATTGTISGTPTVTGPATDYAITAYNLGGSGKTVVNIAVNDILIPVTPPPNISYQTPQTYTVNKAIADLSPTNAGGAVPANIYGQVTTFAGAGPAGSTNGTGTAAGFHFPVGLATDKAGNIYVADSENNLIRKITSGGVVSTFAGSGQRGSVNGNGLSASFASPRGVATDDNGNVYVGDFGNNLIRKISPGGDVTTIAGTLTAGAANSAGFNEPEGLTVDPSGNIYVADMYNSVIKKITPAGVVTIVAGNGVGTTKNLFYPYDVAADNSGNIYVADTFNNLILKITPGGVVTALAGSGAMGTADGMALSASFSYPSGLVVDSQGNIFVADTYTGLIRKITPAGMVTTVAGNVSKTFADGTKAAAGFAGPVGLALDGNGSLYVADADELPGGSAHNSIRKISLTGYEIDKPLPPGLIFDATTGTISGTPTAVWPATDYTVTAHNLGGSSSTVVNIKVNDAIPAIAPPVISYTTPNVYQTNKIITPLAPNTSLGGPVPANAYGQINLFAGSSIAGNADGVRNLAGFKFPFSTATDAAGNVYVADRDNFLIRKITPGAVVTTLAGSGVQGTTNGQGTAASFGAPSGVSVDAAGNVYVADTYANLIRKITPGGLVTTYAGTGTQGANNGQASSATFSSPIGTAVDAAGNVYVTEYGNQLIRKIDPQGIVSTFAGKGSAGSNNGKGTDAAFNNPEGIAVDAAGNIYVADSGNSLVRKIDPQGNVMTIAGGGLLATFNKVYGVAVDLLGNIYIADAGNQRICKIDVNGVLTTLAGGAGLANGFTYPLGMSIDASGNLYVADGGSNIIRIVSTTGYKIDKGLPPGLAFDQTTGIISGTPTVIWPTTIYTVTAYNMGGSSETTVSITVINAGLAPVIAYQTPNKYTINTNIPPLAPNTSAGGPVPVTFFGQTTILSGNINRGNINGNSLSSTFDFPQGVALDAAGNVYVADYNNNLIRKVDPSGSATTFAGSGSAGSFNSKGINASFDHPASVAVDAAGNVYVADYNNNMIRKITPAGDVSTLAGSVVQGSADGAGANAGFYHPSGIALDASGNLYVADKGNNLIRKITAAGVVSTIAGSGAVGANNAQGRLATFNAPKNLAIDASGNIYVTDSGNNLIRIISPAGQVNTYAGNGSNVSADGQGTQAGFNGPSGIVVDGAGNIFVSEFGGNLIRMIVPSGLVSTLAGTGNRGSINGTGTAASFSGPNGLTIDANGNLYIADSFSNEIRAVVTTGFYIDKALPAGMSFDRSTGIISGTPNVLWPPTIYTVTAYNNYGNNSTTLSIEVVAGQTVTFAPLPAKTACDVDFDPGATSNLPITYTSSNPAVATIVSGKIHITGPGTSTITASDGLSSQQEILTVSAGVTPAVSIVINYTADSCNGLPVTCVATPVNGGTTPHYQWQVNGVNSGTDSPQFLTGNIKNNDKITCTLTSNAVCTTSATASSNVLTVAIADPVNATIIISSSELAPICAGTEVTFTAICSIPADIAVFQWQVNGHNAGTNNAEFVTTALADGDVVTCILSSRGQCLVNPNTPSNAIITHLNPANLCTIIIPNTFTPNGDGINDRWNIAALQNYTSCTVAVYNRYGALVYHSVGYLTGWDGTFNGLALPVGTYYYIIDPKNKQKPLSGSVTILR